MMTNLETGDNQVVDVEERINVEFGCGVFPKMQLHKNTIYVISQSSVNQELIENDMNWE